MKRQTWSNDDERNISFYTDLIARYGADVRALNWGSRDSQRLRFSILAQVERINGASVLDVGCGMGDFWDWLKEAGIEVEYTGIDITPAMIEIARRKFPEANFEIRNLFDIRDSTKKQYDFVFSSGIFYYRQSDPFNFLKEMIAIMFAICNKGVAFNSLSSWSSKKEEGEFYADPLETVAFCHTLTHWVVLRHDYHPGDFTIYMYKARKD